MSHAAELLRLPRLPFQQEDAWRTLVSGDTLYRALASVVRDRAETDVVGLVDAWGAYVHEVCRYGKAGFDPSVVRWQWERMRALAWCAAEALAKPEWYAHPAGGDALSQPGAPPAVLEEPDWAWVCVRSLLGASRRDAPTRTCAAGWDPGRPEEAGFIATLELEVLADGAGRVAQDPAHSLAGPVEPGFAQSMREAWMIALGCTTPEGPRESVDGRWRLSLAGQPLLGYQGPSAGGAAARGWWHAIHRLVPDLGVLVLARTGRIDGLEDVALQPVTQLRAKLDAAVRDGRFDTVVVVGQTALDETERILTELRPRTPLRVRSIASAAPAPPPPATL